MLERHDTDILILGSGGAGLFAALHALKAAPELKVTVVAKGLLGKCGCTRMVQGGYNVALSQGDSVERHFMDTIIGGKWLPHQAIAWKLCESAVVRVCALENEIGCFFDRNPDGSLHHKAFAGQTFDRTVHKGDLTGIEIINRLMEQVLGSPVERMEEHRAVALIPSRAGDSLAGVLLIDMRRGVFRFVRARAVLMATGGGPTMYRYHTPSGDKSMDGLAMSLRLGLPARDMEMVQFHPTGLLGGDDTRMTGTVLEEGLRGAGGHLLGADGRRFMLEYDELGERGTRDVVSRAIYSEMRKGNTTRRGGVYLSMSHLGPADVRERFRGMVRRCADCGFDLAAGKVEVVPTAHYFMGGLVCDPDTRTGLPGLYRRRRGRGRCTWLQPPGRQRRRQLDRVRRHRRRRHGRRGQDPTACRSGRGASGRRDCPGPPSILETARRRSRHPRASDADHVGRRRNHAYRTRYRAGHREDLRVEGRADGDGS